MRTIAKQQEQQRFLFKIHSSRLAKSRWNLSLSIDEARRNEEVISLASSQVLRWIDELNGNEESDKIAAEIKQKIKELKRNGLPGSKKEVRSLYNELDRIQFKPDYLSLIIDKTSHYYRACKGFKINGIKYKRLLGTNGGIKNSTIIFVSERLHDELDRRINNGRDESKPIVPAKLEAYKALSCSASIPVSFPEGVLVVNDAETKFKENILCLSDENGDEPIVEEKDDYDITLDANDGCGLMSPALAERWSNELGLEYVSSGFNTRFPFEKGMVFTFDFVDFAEKVAHTYIVKDAWGNEVDVRDVELVLTTSMLKLWDSYGSCDEYMRKSKKNGYTFGITKSCPEELESYRHLNYQFIQSYCLDDDDIEELISPTVEAIKGALGDDWRKSALFLRGMYMNSDNVQYMPDDFIKAIMIDERIIDDPFVQSSIYGLIKNRINEAKVGVIDVHGNYSIASADPYIICQSMFGLEQTGLLRSGEIYNEYWANNGAGYLACYRAPMTSANNIRKVTVADREELRYWYQYMKTCTIFNAWDTATAALNGMDYDGDLVMLTDNRILVDRLKELRTIVCVQRKAEKKIPTEEDFIASNIGSFGNEIGQTTNWITSMFEVQSHFTEGSKEYETLAYRIKCGQQYQQNAIKLSRLTQ